MIWAGIAALTGLVCGLLLLGVLRARRVPVAVDPAAVLRDQLAEIARARADGTLDPTSAAATELELQRRLLAAPPPPDLAAPAGPPWGVALPVLLVLLLGGPLLYMTVGRPALPDLPAAGRVVTADTQRAEARATINALKQRLSEKPDDLDTWLELAQFLQAGQAFDELVVALTRATTLAPERGDLLSALGEAHVLAARGTVTPAAREIFARVLKSVPDDPRARFFAGLAAEQAGDAASALRLWVALVKESPADAPWVPMLRERIGATAATAGIDPATLGLPPVGGAAPSAADLATIRPMVEGLAARLKENPDDVAGWQRLGRSYAVLGEADKSRDAYREAATRAPGDWEAQWTYARTLFDPAEGRNPPPEFFALTARILALKPDHPESLWFTALAAKAAGDGPRARDLLSRLLALIPPQTPLHAAVQKEIDQIP